MEVARLGARAAGEIEAENEDVAGVEGAAGFGAKLAVDEEDGDVFAGLGRRCGAGIGQGVFGGGAEGGWGNDEEAVDDVAEFGGEG